MRLCLVSCCEQSYMSRDYGRFLSHAHASSTDSTKDYFLIINSPSSLPPLVEPLSRRELDVLRLLQTELSGPEIARELTVALSTVRTHTKSIYSKLNVNSRKTAV